ncbi:gfo/Idh/MocA family oxidoreductase [Candidatus Aerophobetes bacterium]|uniref:Gfo/Idh/MocA family oxidoreductase n=1 Tax=Aerophobetes bacterium TaxID=2030807 RepID=A0A497E7R3_UNCAE|nr:MAG: gfo/Idh/MocA family oxidoreductase [Candidatus Aerophobetes bacterium]
MAKDFRKVRVAMIGAGSMANRVHYPSLASFDDVEMVAICDLDPDRLSRTAERFGIEKRYTDYRKMIEEVAPDAVYAIGQPHMMYDVWLWCLNEGLNLYIEKPMGITIHQARALAYLAEKKGCITQVSFQRRSCPMLVKLKEECLKRGPIVHAVCMFYKCNIEPFLGARDHMMDDGVHAIDTLRWMCGGEVVRIKSLTRRVLVPDINFISSLLEFDSGATGVMINSWTSGRRIFRVEMHAPGICAEADPEGKGYLYADGDTRGVEYDTRKVAGSEEFYVYAGFQAKNREFIDCLKSGKQPASNFSDAVKTMEVAEKILAKALLEE